MDYTVHEILQARILEGVIFPFSRGSSQPRDRTHVSCIVGRFFTSWATKGSPRILEWVAYPFSSGSSRPRNQTGVSCIVGRTFTNWAIREVWGNQHHEMWKHMYCLLRSLFCCKTFDFLYSCFFHSWFCIIWVDVFIGFYSSWITPQALIPSTLPPIHWWQCGTICPICWPIFVDLTERLIRSVDGP